MGAFAFREAERSDDERTLFVCNKMKSLKLFTLIIISVICLFSGPALAQDNPPTVSSSAPNINGRAVGISVTGSDDKQLASLVVDWGDGNISSCACNAEEAEYMESCSTMGNTRCAHTFSHIYSRDNYFTIGVWSVDRPEGWIEGMRTQSSETQEHFITIGKPSEPPPSWFPTGLGTIEITNPLKLKNFEDFIKNIAGLLFTMALVLAPILLILAGIMFLTAGGNPEKVNKATRMILYTLIGFAIIALANVFVKLIKQLFGLR